MPESNPSDGALTANAEPCPLVQENWRKEGQQAIRAFEVPIFTDAWITGEATEGFGPYQLFNAVPVNDEFHVARPALVLRYAVHVNHELPSLEETREDTYHAGWLQDEVAAIVALCLGIRAQAGDVNREFAPGGDPRGRPIAWPGKGHPPALPPAGRRGRIISSAVGPRPLELLAPLRSMPALPGPMAVALVRAARLYQAAMWVAEVDPNQSWILLSSAVEAAAGQWNEKATSSLESLRAWNPSLAKLLTKRGGEELAGEVAEKLNKISGATWKFLQFLNRFRPDPPPDRPAPFFQLDWSQPKFEAAMKKVYHYRSRALHGGFPFPAPMSWPPTKIGEGAALSETPAGTSGTGIYTWVKDDIPLLLHVFEYIVRHSILNWWKSCSAAMPSEGQMLSQARVPEA